MKRKSGEQWNVPNEGGIKITRGKRGYIAGVKMQAYAPKSWCRAFVLSLVILHLHSPAHTETHTNRHKPLSLFTLRTRTP